ncbi:hypothetical protein ABK040_011459 [Willaertia magna]
MNNNPNKQYKRQQQNEFKPSISRTFQPSSIHTSTSNTTTTSNPSSEMMKKIWKSCGLKALSKFKLVELKEELRKKGLTLNGNKKEIIKRLHDKYLEEEGGIEPNHHTNGSEDDDEEDDLSDELLEDFFGKKKSNKKKKNTKKNTKKKNSPSSTILNTTTTSINIATSAAIAPASVTTESKQLQSNNSLSSSNNNKSNTTIIPPPLPPTSNGTTLLYTGSSTLPFGNNPLAAFYAFNNTTNNTNNNSVVGITTHVPPPTTVVAPPSSMYSYPGYIYPNVNTTTGNGVTTTTAPIVSGMTTINSNCVNKNVNNNTTGKKPFSMINSTNNVTVNNSMKSEKVVVDELFKEVDLSNYISFIKKEKTEDKKRESYDFGNTEDDDEEEEEEITIDDEFLTIEDVNNLLSDNYQNNKKKRRNYYDYLFNDNNENSEMMNKKIKCNDDNTSIDSDDSDNNNSDNSSNYDDNILHEIIFRVIHKSKDYLFLPYRSDETWENVIKKIIGEVNIKENLEENKKIKFKIIINNNEFSNNKLKINNIKYTDTIHIILLNEDDTQIDNLFLVVDQIVCLDLEDDEISLTKDDMDDKYIYLQQDEDDIYNNLNNNFNISLIESI